MYTELLFGRILRRVSRLEVKVETLVERQNTVKKMLRHGHEFNLYGKYGDDYESPDYLKALAHRLKEGHALPEKMKKVRIKKTKEEKEQAKAEKKARTKEKKELKAKKKAEKARLKQEKAEKAAEEKAAKEAEKAAEAEAKEAEATATKAASATAAIVEE